ncbi:sialate O-acetylesterase [Runella sp.]|uniref:T9SS type A sorting domain-containing protein n=1 Tax=Runella sp. TaxID=1960881 RepID=UPI003D10B31A
MKLNRYLKGLRQSFACILFPLTIFGQINITFPSSRIVFQRDNFGNGKIRVTGQYSKSVDRVEARVIPMNPGQGEQTDWRVIQDNPQGGFYSGSITVRGGWYELQIRGIANGNTVSTSELQRVGVGEVFLVAGQSNAQGFFNYGAPGPGDDRVNCVNYRNIVNQNNSFPAPDFVRMSDNGSVGPRGLSSWCWGRLGDMIASRLNVPVLFYNAAWEGTASKNWSETVDGGTTNSIYINDTYPQGQPYANLKMALNYYASVTGIRAVLWHQGEADNLLNTSAVTYQANLQKIIEKSRQHFGKTVGWVVARASFYNARIYQEVINGQNQVVLNGNSVFFGPSTDGIQIPRPDGTHFQNGGLSDAANAWNSALDDNFFNSCFPQVGSFPDFSISCAGGNQLNINVQGAYSSVQWNNGANGSSVNFGPGNYQATVRDFAGNVYYTPTINVPNDLQSAPINISVDGKLPLCQGSSVGLISSGATGNQWNTGSTSQRIEVSTSGTYSVSTQNLYGCKGSASINVTSFSSPLPAKPTIASSGPLTFCQGGSVNLTATSAAEYRWSTGDRGQVVTARNTGTFEVRVLDDKGCTSEPTSVTVQVNAPPAAPTINASGNTTFCQGGRVTLSSNYNDGNIWSSGQQSKDIEVTASGTYNVRFRDANGCDGISNNITVNVNPLPAAPTITPERPIVFCDGDSTVLTSSSSAQYNWNNGARGRRINILKAGSFSLTVTDANGCTSPGSEVITVKVNTLPAAPTITTDRSTTTICENEVITLTSSTQSGYIWSNGQNTKSVTVNLPGRYSARTVDANQCQSPSSNTISVTVNALPAKPIITALGPTTFCQGGQVSLTTNYSSGIAWSNFQNSQTITATTGGNYNVSYVDNNGCRSVSDAFPVKVNPLPAAPTIVNERPTTFCEFDNTVLTITSGGNIFEWSTGERGRSIKVYSPGQLSATVFEPTTGCTSPASAPITIVVNPNPGRPTISVGGPTTICADQSLTLTAPDASAYQWSNQANTKSVAVNFAGDYTLIIRNQFGCPSPASEPVNVKVNQLPSIPSVIAEGRLTFCDGEQVGLRVESNYDVLWNTGETVKRIVATKSGNYAARVRDEIGCLSPFTGPTRVDVKDLPATPVVEKVGAYTLQVSNPTASAVYTWKSGAQALTETKSIIRVNQSGAYTAAASVQYFPTLTCVSKTSAVFDYVLEVSNNGLAVYPNPSPDGKVIVETLEVLSNATLIVYDLTGKPVKTINVPSFNDQKLFDFTDLPVGIYMIQVQNQSFKGSKKLIIAQ